MKRLSGILALAACAAVAAAGCATAPQQPGGPRSSTRPATVPGSRTAASPTASPSPPPSSPHKQRAIADTNAILNSFVPPPGARRLQHAPAAGGGMLRQIIQSPDSPNLIDKPSWWQVPGQPKQVLAWERAHLPHMFTPNGTGSSGGPKPPIMWDDQYSLPDVPNLLAWPSLLVGAVSAGHGTTDIRVDAQVVWVPAKPAAERVPSAAKVVTVTVLTEPGVGPIHLAGPVTVSDPAKVRRIAAMVDGLSVNPPAVSSCPAFMNGVSLTFRAGAVGPALVKVTDATPCHAASFTADGRQLQDLAPGPSFDRQVAALAGLPAPMTRTTPGGGVAHVSPSA